MATKGKEMKIEVQVSFKGGSYPAFLELALCAAMPRESCGVCGGAIGDPQNAVKIMEIIAVDSVEIEKRLKGKIICQKCRGALKESGITLTE